MPFRYIAANGDARFWRKVEKSDGCWLWRGARNQSGYGHLKVAGEWWIAHRRAWVLAGHELPADRDLCHRCDNPACVRPNHMFVGTRADNMRDAKAKGRTASGERHGRSRLSAEVVRELRRVRNADGLTYKALGARFGISPQHAHYIVTQRYWNISAADEANGGAQ